MSQIKRHGFCSMGRNHGCNNRRMELGGFYALNNISIIYFGTDYNKVENSK